MVLLMTTYSYKNGTARGTWLQCNAFPSIICHIVRQKRKRKKRNRPGNKGLERETMNGIKRVSIDDCLCYSSSCPCRANSYSTGRQENPSIRYYVWVCMGIVTCV